MNALVLGGLDGSNPLGFLAALGVVNAVADRRLDVRLAWIDDGAWRPSLAAALELESLLTLLDEDRASCASDPALGFSYEGGVRDLKPPPALWRSFLRTLALETSPDDRRAVDWAAAFATDVAVDNNGNTKPTALHFTAGQQKFLDMAIKLQAGTTRDDLREAICGPWRYERKMPVLMWDATSSRDYALRASNPAMEKKAGVPGADWLALRGLSFLAAFPRGDRIVTTGCGGEWKTGWFRWPVWDVPLGREMIRTVVRLPGLGSMSATLRRQRGVAAIFECRIKRSDQGGYGSFAPPSALTG